MAVQLAQKTEEIPLNREAFEAFTRFVTRRFDEISAEITANTQLLDMAENGIARKFAEVLAILGSIGYQGAGASAHNVGVELSAVVRTTEDAANKILDAAERIGMLAETRGGWEDENARAERLAAVAAHTQEILAACAFQDLTGQRIGKTLANIRKAQTELAETLQRLGLKIDLHVEEEAARESVQAQKAQSQGDIDRLF